MKQSKLSIVILAAGKGTRLGGNVPKPLTVLPDGSTIMGRQTEALQNAFGDKANIHLVVGYKAEAIVENFPTFTPIYADKYDITNTSKSLLTAFASVNPNQGVLWLNGDVVFDLDLMYYIDNRISQGGSFVTVDTKKVQEEEVKYITNKNGYITSLSKTVPIHVAEGEAIGINYVSSEDFQDLKYELLKAPNDAYFEMGIENSIRNNGSKFKAFDISQLGVSAVEVDFSVDLDQAKAIFF